MPTTIGPTQNSQSWPTAHPPAKIATPVLRAGFTEVLVTGMLIRCIRVRQSPMAKGAKPEGTLLSGRPHYDEQEHHGHNRFANQRSEHRVSTGRMDAVTVRRESARESETGLARGDKVQNACCRRRSNDLDDDVGRQFFGRKTPARPQPNGYGRVEVVAGNVPDRIGHRQDRKPERKRDADKTNSELRKCGRQNSAAASTENQPENADKLRDVFLHSAPFFRIEQNIVCSTRRYIEASRY